ncbi:EthD domain-containing protein [Lentzea cavernae]|uniref:EthD domain-containing protein n=1 Tax=Lentzea cavernae TaxID=2020703 RepID=UPI00174AABAD|nr:EthD domain-containing protein [Lentzea cavernae]
MITTIAFLKARAGMSRDEFVDHYENHHVPLVLSIASGPFYYARNYLPPTDERGFPAEFDAITQMRFADAATRRTWLSLVLAPGSGIAEDEERFLDRSRTRSWIVDERLSGEAAPGR